MPRKPDFSQLKPAITTVDRRRIQKCFQRWEDGTITEHDTLEEVVGSAKSPNIDVRHTYEDRYDADGIPTRRLSDTQDGQVRQLVYCRFVKPFEVPEEEEEE